MWCASRSLRPCLSRTCYGHWLGSPFLLYLVATTTTTRKPWLAPRTAWSPTDHPISWLPHSSLTTIVFEQPGQPAATRFRSGFVLERSIHPWLACSRKHAYAIDRCEIERLTRPLSCMSALVTNCRGGSEARAPSAQRQPRQHAILSILVRELKLPCCV